MKLSTIKHRTNKLIRTKLDKLWSELVKKQAGYKCEICGKDTQLNSHHIISRSNNTLRWDLRNGCCLCVSCHKFSRNSAHNDPIFFMSWLIANRLDDYNYLSDKKNESFKKNYDEILKTLEVK